jgi:hypothetical protein
MKIVILEDNAERRVAMQACLESRFRQYEIKFFGTSKGMIGYLREHRDEALCIALDHDLEPESHGAGVVVDPGTGRDVADFLAHHAPVCPIVIHTTNVPAAVGMEMVLQESNWTTYRVLPHDDLEWIATDWFRTMRQAIVRSAKQSATTEAVGSVSSGSQIGESNG